MRTVTINSGKKKPNNRLILLGNGFDLSHGLKTSYSDFIEWYLNKVKEIFDKEDYFEDKLIELRSVDSLLNIEDYSSPYGQLYDSNNIFEKHLKLDVIPTFKNKLWSKILNTLDVIKWVDIEQLYYDEYKLLVKKSSSLVDSNEIIDDLIELNLNLKDISSELKTYLCDNIKMESSNFIPEFKKLIYSKEPKLILNFNYTNTVNSYLENYDFPPNKDIVIPLHGNINDDHYPLVFGFGDERDQMYQQIEDLNDNRLMDHFKSFAYFRNQNYSRLLSFIDSEPFEVHTIGLSCGLSDRTLLSQIFEHENCQKIHIQYYKDENGYQDVARNISRHFSDKQELRRKLVNFEGCEECPQISK
ncbi:AbiH family protein [Marivirga salinae]|uniref:AbiH family protein n=1 Tax=Marivirga salinarum TaxID=3059078 RepID=A0AA51RF54_9BACT|nr:AbiH family protein [Marivirga sp. BDSF4-3]WMN12810.1 AbiH family protein [Marivirga sp. BDSF4-3]